MRLPAAIAIGAAAFACAAARGQAQTTDQSTAPPAPVFTAAPTPAPRFDPAHPLIFHGNLRAFEFYRTNGVQNASNPNRQAFNFGGNLHLEYHFTDNWYLGTTYSGAYPFGLNGQHPEANNFVDNSLPGFSLSTFSEAFVGYSSRYVQGRVGDQIINTPWANGADSRIKPAAFQGVALAANVTPNMTVMFYDMDRFESRTSNAFGRYTLLTAPVPGASNALSPATAEVDTPGFQMGGFSYTAGKLGGFEVMDYQFDAIANMFYAQGLLNVPGMPWHPQVGAQYAYETEVGPGPGTLGRIRNQTVGLQVGVTPVKNLLVQAAGDYMPWESATVQASSCSTLPSSSAYFLPGGGTPDCAPNGNGTVTVYYGGIASPYTDSYAADPLYTTSISQGMADRRSAGTSAKLSATWQPFDKQLRLIVSEAWYNYGNPAGPNLTREFNADGTWFFSKVGSGPYHGLSVRYRYADRTQPTLPFDFKYNRAQLEYDF